MYKDEKGDLVSKEKLFQNMKHHITAIVERYKDVIYAWDVVNEAISDGGWQGGRRGMGEQPSPYRNSPLYQIAGDEFIKKAFIYAREADPNVLLFYNDYNAADPGKRDRIYNMVKSMKEEGVPIDGIGMQGHYNVYGPSMEDVDAALTKYSTIVKHIHITELDIRANQEMGGQLNFSRDGGNISQGQKQLLCIARVMLCLPPMLILDEATSSIDTRTEVRIQKAFARMMQGRTSFIVAHRLSTIREADVILVMKDGHIVEQGNHDELLAAGGFYAKLYNSQFEGVET